MIWGDDANNSDGGAGDVGMTVMGKEMTAR